QQREAGPGRPSAKPPRKVRAGQRHAAVRPDAEALRRRQPPPGGGGLGTPREAEARREAEGIAASNAPSQVEGGWRVLHAPWVVVAALVVTQPTRRHGRLRGRPV